MNIRAGLADYPRVPKDAYFSIDPCIADGLIWALREIGLDPTTLPAWECAAGRGDLMRGLERHGMVVGGTDLFDHPDREPRIEVGIDVLTRPGQVPAHIKLVATNPPYTDRMPEKFAKRLLQIAPHAWIALLVRAEWLSGRNPRRRALLQHERAHAVVHLGRRPQWVEGELLEDPRFDYVWHIWRPAGSAEPRAINLYAPAMPRPSRRRKR